MALTVRDPLLSGIVTDLCSVFVTPQAVAWRIEILLDVRLLCCARNDAKILVPEQYYVADNEAYRIEVDLAEQRGSIWLKEGSSPACANALKNLCAFLLAREGALVLHSAGVLHRDRAYLFIGPSGSGKSTVAVASAPEHAVLSQEAIGVIEEDACFRACALPYAADNALERRAAGSYEVAGIFCLVKASANAVRRRKRSLMLADMSFYGVVSGDYLDRACRFIARTPCYDLHFLPDSSFWRCIDEGVREEVSCA